MKNSITGILCILIFTLPSCKKDDMGERSTVETVSSTPVDYFSVRLKGRVIDEGSGVVTRSFTWGRNPSLMEGSDKTSVLASSISGNEFDVQVDNLNPDWTYYFRASASSEAGTGNGEILPFTTYKPYSMLTYLPFAQRTDGVSFVIGDKGYYGLGRQWSSVFADFWEFDSTTETWTRKADCPQALHSAVGFSINGKGYVATGQNGAGSFSNNLWEYDPVADTWTPRTTCPQSKAYASCFVVNDKAYITAGSASLGGANNTYEYDPVTNWWTARAAYPGNSINFGVGFESGGKGFVGTGYTSLLPRNQVFEYDPLSDSWIQKSSYPGMTYLEHGFSLKVDGKIYMGAGDANSEVYHYDPALDTWKRITGFKARQGCLVFCFPGKAYIGAGCDASNFYNDFYKFIPLN